jgi:hypothetical protein
VAEWRAAGSPAQEGIAWPRPRWVARFPAHADTFTRLPDWLNRAIVRSFCTEAVTSPEAALRAFLTAMVWGYGRVGYGPFRVERILGATPDAGVRLQNAARELTGRGPVRAYALLGDDGVGQMPGLGPAFGTKFLYFCSPADRPALILDRLVAAWLRAHTDLQLNEVRWSSQTYARYLNTMTGWAGELGVAADDLEACIVGDQAGLTGGQGASEP